MVPLVDPMGGGGGGGGGRGQALPDIVQYPDLDQWTLNWGDTVQRERIYAPAQLYGNLVSPCINLMAPDTSKMHRFVYH